MLGGGVGTAVLVGRSQRGFRGLHRMVTGEVGVPRKVVGVSLGRPLEILQLILVWERRIGRMVGRGVRN